MNDHRIHKLLVQYVRGELNWTQVNFILSSNNVDYTYALDVMHRVEMRKTFYTGLICFKILVLAVALKWLFFNVSWLNLPP